MRHVRALRPAALAVVLSAGVAVWPAHGQTVIGGDGQPSVEIDLGVLNSLGPAPTVPDLLRPTLPYNMRAFPRGADTHDNRTTIGMPVGGVTGDNNADQTGIAADHTTDNHNTHRRQPYPEWCGL